jgi:hypothetical protein
MHLPQRLPGAPWQRRALHGEDGAHLSCSSAVIGPIEESMPFASLRESARESSMLTGQIKETGDENGVHVSVLEHRQVRLSRLP